MSSNAAGRASIRVLATGASISVVGAAATGVFGLARIKGLAVVLGPGALGVYGQLWTFVFYAGSFAALGIGVGTTKIAARGRERNDVQAISAISWLALALPVVVGAVFLVATLASAVKLAPLLLGTNNVQLIVLAAVSIPFVGMQTSFQSLLQGFEDARGQALVYMIYGASFTILSIGGALLDGVTGAVVGLAVGNVILGGLYLIRARLLVQRAGGSLEFRPSRDLHVGELLRSLLPIGSGALLGSVIFSAADIAVRTALLHGSGKAAAGLWFALMSISVQFVAAIVAAITYFTAPLIARAAARDNLEGVRTVLDDSLRLTMLTVVPVIALIAAFRYQLVGALFSRDFAPMSRYIPAQMAGDFMRTLVWPLGLGLVPLGLTAAWVMTGAGVSVVFGVTGSLFALRWGLSGAVASYILLWSITAAIVVSVLLRRGAWSPTRRSVTGLVLSIVSLTAAILLPQTLAVAVVLAASVGLFVGVTAPAERAAVWARLCVFRRGPRRRPGLRAPSPQAPAPPTVGSHSPAREQEEE